jgi:hypothetical protein
MLLAAAERGVKVNVVAFKEVPQVMYRKSSLVSIVHRRARDFILGSAVQTSYQLRSKTLAC